MAAQTFALLVGIDAYTGPVPPLTGCVNDIRHFEAWLGQGPGAQTTAIQTLTNADATHANVIAQFRQHLGRARAGDVALFVYCGHGAQSKAAGEFHEFDRTGLDEGLVCIDSRLPGGHDLADKELAVLIDEVAKRDVHVAFILDACHSGSGTRSVDAFSGLRSRMTTGTSDVRPLESYLGGHYAMQLKRGERIAIPSGRHILMAACDRRQEAKESPTEKRGVFSSTLLEVLEQANGDIAYADLFMRCRTHVRKRAKDQDPQFEPIGQFNPWGGFLGRAGGGARRTYKASFDRKAWRLNCGAIQGLPTDPALQVGVVLYPEGQRDQPVATARAIQVGTNDATLDLGSFQADPAISYDAEITSMPVAPLLVHCSTASPARAALDKALKQDLAHGIALTDEALGTRYALEAQGDMLKLVQRESGVLIQAATAPGGEFAAAATALLRVAGQVAQWERSLTLENHASRMDSTQIEFTCCEMPDDGPEFTHTGDEVTLESVNVDGDWSSISARLQARNSGRTPLHWTLLYFSAAYGIDVFGSGTLPPGADFQTVYTPKKGFRLERDPVTREFKVEESVDRFKLIVSSKPVDGFMLIHQDIPLGQTIDTTPVRSRAVDRDDDDEPVAKAKQDDWLTRNLRVRVVPRLDELGDKPWQSDNGVVTVTGHGSVKVRAKVSMSPARSSSRAVNERQTFLDALEAAGLSLPVFSNTRGDSPNVLELNDIQVDGATTRDEINQVLAAAPLSIELDLPLDDAGGEQGILPFVFDGEHILLGGDVTKDEAGRTHISIDHLPEAPSDRRSLGGSLKLYFFKTYLKRTNLNKLRWVDYAADGSFTQREDGVAAKVAAPGCRRVLVMVHGIIGDTEGMAEGIRQCALDGQFDLVLTFDYENLSTAIEATAADLKAQLAAAGLADGDDKHVTLLVHSMGGLVSRWFVERLGGHRVVDHLVMCGTPNNGSPFGKFDEARQIMTLLTGLAANYAPTLLPFTGPLLFALNRSKKLTPTLTQMNPGSEFIQTLNTSPDPGIRYTILAGNVAKYKEPTDSKFAGLITKVGTSKVFDLLFSGKDNDIAVAMDSILRVGPRTQAPTTQPVDCHHLNYFVSSAGQAALKSVEW